MSQTFSLIFIIVSFVPCSLFGWSFFGATPEPVPQRQFTLMIDPAGDARDPGREIDDSFERTLTMQCAEELKKTLEPKIPGLRVILTRFTGEIVEPSQTSSFANRLKVDVFISLHFYETKEKMKKIAVYQYLLNPATDFIEKKRDELTLLPYDQAYRFSTKKSGSYAESLFNFCKDEGKQFKIACAEPLALPFKPLMGITAPALGIEIGIKKKEDVKDIEAFLERFFETLINSTSIQ